MRAASPTADEDVAKARFVRLFKPFVEQNHNESSEPHVALSKMLQLLQAELTAANLTSVQQLWSFVSTSQLVGNPFSTTRCSQASGVKVAEYLRSGKRVEVRYT